MPWILLTRKPYNEKKGRPSSIGDKLSRWKFVDRFFSSMTTTVSSNNDNKDEEGHLFVHKEATLTCEESMGDANEYRKLLEPTKHEKVVKGRWKNMIYNHAISWDIRRSIVIGILTNQTTSLKTKK